MWFVFLLQSSHANRKCFTFFPVAHLIPLFQVQYFTTSVLSQRFQNLSVFASVVSEVWFLSAKVLPISVLTHAHSSYVFFNLSLININELSIEPFEVLEMASQFKSKMLKATLWVQFLSQQCALSNGSCPACLWKVRKHQKGMVQKWKPKYIIFYLATRPVTLKRKKNTSNNNTNTKFFIYSGCPG